MPQLLQYSCTSSVLKFNQEVSVTPGFSMKEKPLLTVNFKLDSHELQGEAPVLPNYLPLNALEIEHNLALIQRSERSIEDFNLNESYFGLFTGPHEPQVMMALEGALLQFLIEKGALKVEKSLVPVRPLLFASEHFHCQQLPKNQEALKIKIARGALENDLPFLVAIRKLNPKAQIIVDPNRALADQEERLLEKMSREIGIKGVELTLEEALGSSLKLEIILDSNLHEIQKSALPAKVTGLVYKPARDGALSSLAKWLTDYEVTLSSTYESLLGLNHIAMSAVVFGLSAPQGLGTYHYLTHMNFDSPLWIDVHSFK